jgi:hypothetical protein
MAFSSGLGMAAIFWRRERLVRGMPVVKQLSLFLPGVVIIFAGLPLAFGMALISSPMRAFAASTTSSASLRLGIELYAPSFASRGKI